MTTSKEKVSSSNRHSDQGQIHDHEAKDSKSEHKTQQLIDAQLKTMLCKNKNLRKANEIADHTSATKADGTKRLNREPL